jgi:hypothetical protein
MGETETYRTGIDMEAKTFNLMYEAFLNSIPDEDEQDGL